MNPPPSILITRRRAHARAGVGVRVMQCVLSHDVNRVARVCAQGGDSPLMTDAAAPRAQCTQHATSTPAVTRPSPSPQPSSTSQQRRPHRNSAVEHTLQRWPSHLASVFLAAASPVRASIPSTQPPVDVCVCVCVCVCVLPRSSVEIPSSVECHAARVVRVRGQHRACAHANHWLPCLARGTWRPEEDGSAMWGE
eukprot:18962-Rhodomonas_salina.1